MTYKIPKINWLKNGLSLVSTNAFISYSIQKIDKTYLCYYGNGRAKEFKSVTDAMDWVQDTHYPAQVDKLFERDPDAVDNTVNWFKQAKPNPTAKDIYVQIGCHLEEVCEMLQALNLTVTPAYRELKALSDEYKQLAKECLNKDLERVVESWDKLALLDSLADQCVTSVGVGYMLNFDMQGAIGEVNRSNYSKFENGVPIFDKNGKIAKGVNYESPQLEPYL